MNRSRYQPEVIVWNFRESDTYVPKIRALDVPLHSFPTASSGALKLTILRRMVMQIKPEVVHSYSFFTNLPAFLCTLSSNRIAIGGVRSDFGGAKNYNGPLLGRLCALWPRTQVFNSWVAAERAKKSRSFFVPKECSVVRNGLDLEMFRPMPIAREGRVQIVAVGSLLPLKRWDRLILAASVLKKRGFDFLIRIAGDGPLYQSLKQQTQVLGLAECVEFTGYVDDIPRLLANASFLVHPSDSEGCPNAVMEAMACGRAVVATAVGDVPHLVEDQKTGFVVPFGDTATLIERVALLTSNPDLCCRMGAIGRAKAEREFGLDRLVCDTLTAYRVAGWKDS